jgi:excisionase family DNA binding protein
LFRNAREAQDVKRDFMLHGIELDYLGKFNGDPRSAVAWRIERTQEIDDEMWARKTSENVGRALEELSKKGQPIGPLPEGYKVGERAPSFMGQSGRILTYVRNEPLATIIAEAAELYLDGYSYTQLAVWSETTELKGRTAEGRVMNSLWWRKCLTNPKYAGHQMPCTYAGFKPGKESPKRPRRKNGVTHLVPCHVPALYPLEKFERIVQLSASRNRGAKHRYSYTTYLLSGIAYDERCGHLLGVHSREDDRLRMICSKVGTSGRNSGSVRVDAAQRQLDEVVGAVRLDDPTLIAMVEQELVRLARDTDEPPIIKPDPERGRILAALAALGMDAPATLRSPLEARLDELERRDEDRRLLRMEHVQRFRAAVDDLRHWSEIWATADPKRKNDLLKTAGVEIVIGRDPAEPSGLPVLREIQVTDPTFALALAAALQADPVGLQVSTGFEPCNPTPGTPRGTVSDLIAVIGRDGSTQPVRLRLRGQLPSSDLMTVGEAARMAGTGRRRIYRAIRAGEIRSLRSGKRGSHHRLVARDVEALRDRLAHAA